MDIKGWSKDSFFIVISSGQNEIISEIREILFGYGLNEETDFSVFNKFIENRKGVNDVKDYFFGYSRDYGEEVKGFKIFSRNQGSEHLRRIVILGGSTSDCGYNTDITNWTEWLGRILGDKGYQIEIWSGGIQGYASSQELLKLIRDGLLIKPDLVISFSGINDATGLGIIDEHPFVMRSVKYLLKDENRSIEYGLENHEKPSSLWFANMKIMKSICDTFSIPFVGILEPFPFYDRRKKQDKFAHVFFSESVQQRIFEFYDDVKREIVHEKYLVDLSDLLIDKPQLVYDYIHCDTNGNYMIAESIEKYIIPYLQ